MKRTMMMLAVASALAFPAAEAGAQILQPERPEISQPRPAAALIVRQAPVPMLLGARPPAFIAISVPLAADEAKPTEPVRHGIAERDARSAIEADGYKTVLAITKAGDGTWHARALRGTTEVSLHVDAQGSVFGE